jgi:hypothetical protein
MRERHVRLAAALYIAPLIRATCRPREVDIVDCADYATNFLYNQRRPSWRRQTCPRTSRPVMLRLGMMTRRRCQVVGLAVRRSNPNLRMLMVVNLIDGMLTHSAQAARCRHRPQRTSRRPSSAFTIVAPAATARNNTASSNPVLDPPRHENHSESGGHSGQRNPDFALGYYDLVVTAIFLPTMLHHDSRTPTGVRLGLAIHHALGKRFHSLSMSPPRALAVIEERGDLL